jgi:3-methyl-2-oxobutanoate hydroxymethyltransferase
MTMTQKITMITCYDYPSARVFDQSEVDIIFVGDSVGTNVLGYRSELEVTMADMIHHLKAVRRGVTRKTLMVDLPYATYRSKNEALENAKALIGKGADIVKLEGGAETAPIVEALVGGGINVCGHLGFQPQVMKSDKRAVFGSLAGEAEKIYRDAQALEAAGVRYVVLECVPEMVAKIVTEAISVPTIGIGSGKYCSGQVLVSTDLLGWYDMPYRFVKRYENFAQRAVEAVNRFVTEVQSRKYPQRNHGFRIRADELSEFKKSIGLE